MPATHPNRKNVETLNALRQQAVELRLAGSTLAQTQRVVGLSAPTIIAAVKAYKTGGWDAVAVGPRGRPRVDPDADSESNIKQELIRAATLRPIQQGNSPDHLGDPLAARLWSSERVDAWMRSRSISVSRSTLLVWLRKWSLQPPSRYKALRVRATAEHPENDPAWIAEHERFARRARRRGAPVFWVASRPIDEQHYQLYAHDLRGHAFWCLTIGAPNAQHYRQFLHALSEHHDNKVSLVLAGAHLTRDKVLAAWVDCSATDLLIVGDPADSTYQPPDPETRMSDPNKTVAAPEAPATAMQAAGMHATGTPTAGKTRTLTHLQRLEAESLHIMREVVAEANNPVMLYSVGKDSAVMLHLARKAFFPAPPPFPLLHVDTTWKFKAMYEFRDSIVKQYGLELLTHTNPEGLRQKVNPFTHGSALHTDIMKTQGLKQALDEHRFDFAFGGARRDEEKSRAKERVFSFRSAQHRWDAKNQRPELWKLYNARKHRDESIRVFPLSNWTELDIWQYIHREEIPIVPLYLAAERPVVLRDGSLIMVDDERMPMQEGEVPQMRSVRFRTLGCYPLTGAVESTATTLEEIIQEMLLTRTSERQGRMIDHDAAASMEKKKQEGYF